MNRRDCVPFDPRRFEQRARHGDRLSLADTFGEIYRRTHWNGPTSVSGTGASLAQTARLRAVLPELLRDLGVDVLLDLPCGDFSWMQAVDLPVRQVLGADVVPDLIAANQARYGRADRRFLVLDLTTDPLPAADLLLCRDALVHLSFADIHRALANLTHSAIPYVLTTTFPATAVNDDITTGDWQPLNLEALPFGFPPPLQLINEGCTEGEGRFADKSLGLWRVADLP